MNCLGKLLIVLLVAMTGVAIAFIFLFVKDKQTTTESPHVPDSRCGGPMELSGESGTFSSLNYPQNYKDGLDCMWQITVEPDKVVHLSFEDFSIGTDQRCSRDFITLQDSLGMIGTFCGKTKPEPLVSLSNRLTVYFNSNERDTDKGFKAHFKAVDPALTSEFVEAGGFLQGEQGELMTPGFPERNYSNSVLYQWKITVPVGERIQLTFNSLELVPSACGDYVQVYGGHRPGSTPLGKFCGPALPKPLTSDFNTMVVRFKSDHTLTSQGFKATYSKIIQTTVAPTTSTTKQTTNVPAQTATTGSGAVIINGRKGEIQSSGYPNPYPAHLQSSWKISVPQGFLVKLQITDLAITGETGMCKDDKLVITDAYSTLGMHCGNIIPPLVVSASNSISVSFQSDNRLTDRGFFAKWEAVYPEDIAEIQGCGFTSKEETGVIKSQNWPMNYKANADCMWNIVVPVGKKIRLTFTDFDVEAADMFTNRCYDNIVVYDINSVTNVMNGKFGPFCGSTLPTTIEPKGRRLVIRFQTDLMTEGKGFRAYWTTDPSLPAPTEPPVLPNIWDNITIDWPSTCGIPAIPPNLGTRIVNGEQAKPNSWPWQVSMQVWPDSRPEPTFLHTCGGTLIHKNWVLTAAHCFLRYADELQRWRMCLGKHNLTITEPSEHCFSVLGIYRHEGFKYPSVPLEFDIALVRLDGDVTPSNEISFACLPSNEEVLPNGKKCYATGWGDETGNSLNPKAAEALNQVALPVVEYDTCKRMDYWWFQIKPSMICCGYALPDELKSVCQGDSGGPLVCQDQMGRPWEVHGITSFGPFGCVMNKKPSVFTRSSAYLPWIENVIRKDIYNKHDSGCGSPAVLNGTEGTVSSMDFPRSYSNKAKCYWDINVAAGKLVHLHFLNFSLEESDLCLNDKLEISDETGSLGKFCGPVLPQDLVSDGNLLHLAFSSNDRVVDVGFAATWRAIDPTEAPCGGVFSGNQGEMMSPNWLSGNYPPLSVCTWRISTPSNTSIHVGFSHFDLQAKNLLGRCVDYVEIINGENLETLGRFCGSTPPATITVPRNTLVIRFLSNGSNQKKGFRGYWTTDASVIPTLPPSTTKP